MRLEADISDAELIGLDEASYRIMADWSDANADQLCEVLADNGFDSVTNSSDVSVISEPYFG